MRDAQGDVLRALDVGFDERLAQLDQRSRRAIRNGTILAAVLCLALFPLTTPVVATVVYFTQLVWVRLAVVAPYRRHYSTGRRIVTRWVARLALLYLSGFHVALAWPGLQVFASPALFAVLCAAAWGYHRWHLCREHARQPILLLEKVALVVLAVLVLTTLVLLVAVGGLLTWLLQGVQGS